MDLGKAFSYPFDDDQWVTSILICGVLIFVPIVGWLMIGGYALEAARNVASGNPRPLPKWENYGEKLRLGFNGFLIAIVYAIPIIILSVLMACFPMFGAATGSEEAVGMMMLLVFFCLFPLIFIISLAIQPLILAATARYLQTNSLGAAFQVSDVVAMVRGDLGGWFILWLLQILCSLVAQAGGVVIIGIFFTIPYAQAVFGHLLGQKLIQLQGQAPVAYNDPYSPQQY
ncbi:MAG: DUF4013 domain-containing protein [Candidatus Viridilinea halotolerans]|uniref:DUF4013 domain-containing protein n=1 Tax=Candidatus Viridilinea halotolerans TaxID=2491704 RepID=A0A426TVM5_9CHLR|nr:MAG: DUF4013 domain-containing protein [Candidatus Viridilinea halotolerans]